MRSPAPPRAAYAYPPSTGRPARGKAIETAAPRSRVGMPTSVIGIDDPDVLLVARQAIVEHEFLADDAVQNVCARRCGSAPRFDVGRARTAGARSARALEFRTQQGAGAAREFDGDGERDRGHQGCARHNGAGFNRVPRAGFPPRSRFPLTARGRVHRVPFVVVHTRQRLQQRGAELLARHARRQRLAAREILGDAGRQGARADVQGRGVVGEQSAQGVHGEAGREEGLELPVTRPVVARGRPVATGIARAAFDTPATPRVPAPAAPPPRRSALPCSPGGPPAGGPPASAGDHGAPASTQQAAVPSRIRVRNLMAVSPGITLCFAQGRVAPRSVLSRPRGAAARPARSRPRAPPVYRRAARCTRP